MALYRGSAYQTYHGAMPDRCYEWHRAGRECMGKKKPAATRGLF